MKFSKFITLSMIISVLFLQGGSPTETHAAETVSGYKLDVLMELNLGSPIRQLRAVPVSVRKNVPPAILVVYGADSTVDPYVEMFFFPKHTLKLALINHDGTILWRRDLGRGVIPGSWFCPVFPFDLDGDGADEIWFVNNPDGDHPLGLSQYRLERLDPATGESIGHWPWPSVDSNQSNSHRFRNFILGGYVRGEPVLVTVQGTYGPISLQGWNPGMTPRWNLKIERDTPGARGSHMCPVVDINGDGVDELFWGERCIEMDSGVELFCCDRDVYRGHSDVVQPLLHPTENKWYIFTCRESGGYSPRVVMYDDKGERVWSDIDEGHMDMGWIARLGDKGERIALAVRIGDKTAGPDGFFRTGVEEFAYKAFSGEKVKIPFSLFRTTPVDINGDGIHELVRQPEGGGGSELLDNKGRLIAEIGGGTALVSKFLDRPGEQLLCYYPDGTVKIWADSRAADTEEARSRYSHPFYKSNRRLTTTGSNHVNLGGI